MDKNGNITLNYDTWKYGIKTPVTGMGDIVNMDIFDTPGIVKIALAPTALATTDFTDKPTFGAFRPETNSVFLGDRDGELYDYNVDTSVLGAKADGSEGMANGKWWKNYLIATDVSGTTIDIDAFDGTSTWTADWESYTADSSSGAGYNKIHPSPADDDLYIGYGRYVARISGIGTFDPTDSGTWTSIDKFLILPVGYVINDIDTIANYLIVSASISGSASATTHFYGARLYYWDLSQNITVAQEFTGFVELNTNVASPLITVDNNIYYHKWADRSWGVTNLSSTQTLFGLDIQSEVNYGGYLTGNKDCASRTNDYFVLGLSSEDGDSKPAGVYHISHGSYTRHTISTGEVGINAEVDIKFVTTIGFGEYLVGYEDAVTPSYVVDHFGKSGYRRTSYGAYMESPLYQVSGSLKKKSYQQLEVSLAKELATGQGVRVSYRKNLSDSWTVMQTFDFATYGAKAQFNDTAKITDASTLQLKVEMTTGASSTTTPELITVRIF